MQRAVVAVAQAELGGYRKAAETAKRAMALYVERGDSVKAAGMKSRIVMFEKEKPYRDE